MIFRVRILAFVVGWLLAIYVPVNSFSQVVPGSVDAGRIIKYKKNIFPTEKQDISFSIPNVAYLSAVPDSAKNMYFTLKGVNIEGITVFNKDKIKPIYVEYLNKEVPLSVVWTIVDLITKFYRNEGYFLSRAYIPEQNIKNGTILIKVVEGYISEVDVPAEVKDHYIVQKYISKLMLEKPTTINNVESLLLRLNDLPGYSFRSVISPIDDSEGEVKLSLIPSDKKGKGLISIDNFSSRYVGPNEMSAAYSTSFFPMHQTSVAVMSSLPIDRLSYGAFSHSVVISPNTTLTTSISTTKNYPGYTLEDFSISSSAHSFGMSLNYQFIRQRQETLSAKFAINSINSFSDILGAPLVRDDIRVLRTGFTYDLVDRWNGSNSLDFTLSKGINGFGSSEADDIHLSRVGAKPDFTKVELTASRLQEINKDIALFISSAGQIASGTLYSTEQFGYGGQSFGRAYDFSEIMGDKGVNGSLELRYNSLKTPDWLKIQPYGFYDFGVVWNFSSDQDSNQSGTSAGLGMRFNTKWHQVANIGVAWPLTRDISTPIYSKNQRSPRFMLQISQEF